MNYSDLKAQIAAWMHRDDLTASIDTFIDLFEAQASRNLRVPEMEKRATSTPTDAYIALPDDFLELRNIQINSDPVRLLEYASPQKIDAMSYLTGVTRYYTLVGNEFQTHPSAADSEVEMAYYGKIPALDETTTTNWLIDSNPDYYLAGCLLQAYLFTLDDRASAYASMVAEKEAFINSSGKSKQYGSGPLVVSAV